LPRVLTKLFVVLFTLALLAAYPVQLPAAGAAGQPAEGAQSPQPWIDAYAYAYPLVLTDAARLYTQEITGAGNNEFFRGSVFALETPEATGDDFLVSAAWLDLSKEPVVVHMPDFGGRYFLARLTDGWTTNVAALKAGPTDKDGRDFAVVGPRWIGSLPFGVTRIASPTNMALLVVRVLSDGTVEDRAAVYALQDKMDIVPLGSYGKTAGDASSGPSPARQPRASGRMKLPPERVAGMDGKAFFTYFATLLKANPPSRSDGDMMARLNSLGVVPAPDFDFDKLDVKTREDMAKALKAARTAVRLPSLPRAFNDARLDPDPSAFYLSRAYGALVALAMNDPSEKAARAETEETITVESDISFRSEGQAAREADFDIREDIERAQKFLKDKVAGHTVAIERDVVPFRDRKGRRKQKIVVRRIVRPNFLLAVEDLKERQIKLVRITERGCVTEGFRVTRTRDNGVASRFEVTHPENMAILALRTTVRSENGFKEVVYTPYSPEIDTWQVRKAGFDYLVERIREARSDLMEKRVKLAGFRRVSDMPIDVSMVLSIIEHIDPERFMHSKGNEIALVQEVLTVIGANTTAAYSYSKSPAGARGLFQFVPDTYRRLREKYREAGLHKDFVSGCNDHTNAAKASLLLFDADFATLPAKWLSAAGKDGRSIGMYLAAAYNCGSARAERSARECKGQWTCLLPEETRIYLKKFEAVWNLRNMLDK
jgi:DNA sulfur modification protein DndE